jgi:beta-glucanase (GH16 family)
MAANLSVPSGFTAGELVFNDDFAGTSLNGTSWNTYITSNAANGYPWFSYGQGGSGVGGFYEAEYDMPYDLSVNNGLTLNAVQQSIVAPNRVNGVTAMQTFPVTSGVVSTYGKMEFDGGYLQISMKEPGGDGSWPGLWLLPGKGAGSVGDNYEIDIQEGGFTSGSANPNDTFAYHLHTPNGTFGGVVDTGVDLTAGYHTYAINWVPGKSITWYLDGREIGQVTSAQAPIPNEPMELIMSNQVANSNAAGWHTTLDGSTPYSMPMQIGDVQLYQAPGSGDTVTGANAASQPVTVANTPPTLTINAIDGNNLITKANAAAGLLISGTASDADGSTDVAGQIVTVGLNGKTYTGAVQTNGTWSVTVAANDAQALSDGSYTVTANVTDKAGNPASQASRVVTVDETAPTLTINAVNGNNLVSNTNFTVSGSATDADGSADVTGQTVTVKILDSLNNIKGTYTTTVSGGGWSVNVPAALANGSYTVTADITDKAGNPATEARQPVTVSQAIVTATPTGSLSAPSGFTASDLVFGDGFAGTSLSASSWNTFITSNAANGYPWFSNGQGGSGIGGPYVADYDMPYEVSVNNGLTLNAVQQSIVASNRVNGVTANQTFPWTSGVVSTYGKMEFDGGYLQISMKEPGGDGSWPSLWLLPGKGAGSVGDNYEIDIQQGGFTSGSANPDDTFAYHLHTPNGTFGGVVDTGVDLTAGYHTYAINWVPGKSITWYLDGREIGQVTSAQAPIPNEPMELIMNDGVANSAASGWRTTLDSSTPQSMPMHIGGVQLYQAPGSSDTVTGANAGSQPVTADRTAPTLTINAIDGNNLITNANAAAGLLISGTASDADGSTDVAGQTVTVGLNGKTYTGAVQTNGTWSVTVTASDAQALSDGSYTVTANVTDKAGNPASQASQVTIDEDRVAETPSLNISSSSLTVAAGRSVGLGVSVGAVDSDDVLSVSISGVPRYESITAAGATPVVSAGGSTYTFSALPTSDWNNGLVLHSTYTGHRHPTAVLTITASNTTSGETSTAASRTISVTDPPASGSVASSGVADWFSTRHLSAKILQLAASRGRLAVGHPPSSAGDQASQSPLALLTQFAAAADAHCGSKHGSGQVVSSLAEHMHSFELSLTKHSASA